MAFKMKGPWLKSALKHSVNFEKASGGSHEWKKTRSGELHSDTRPARGRFSQASGPVYYDQHDHKDEMGKRSKAPKGAKNPNVSTRKGGGGKPTEL